MGGMGIMRCNCPFYTWRSQFVIYNITTYCYNFLSEIYSFSDESRHTVHVDFRSVSNILLLA